MIVRLLAVSDKQESYPTNFVPFLVRMVHGMAFLFLEYVEEFCLVLELVGLKKKS